MLQSFRWFGRQRRAPISRNTNRAFATRFRPSVEPLQERILPANYFPSPLVADGAANSLRADLALANANPGPASDTIYLQGGATYSLTAGGALHITTTTHTITLTATAVPPSSINASALGDRVFLLDPGTHVVLSHLVISGGTAVDDGGTGSGIAEGGGILNQGNLTLNGVVVTKNLAYASLVPDTIVGDFSGGAGGGIFNTASGTVFMNGGAVQNNEARSGTEGIDAQGGGILNEGSFTLVSALVANNLADGLLFTNGDGGGIFNAGKLVVTGGTSSNLVQAGTIIQLNIAQGGSGAFGEGGGLFNGPDISEQQVEAIHHLQETAITATLSFTVIQNNQAIGGFGVEGVGGPGIEEIIGDFFDGSSGQGGGIYNEFSTLTWTTGSLQQNTARGGDGAFGGGNGGDACGGGMYVMCDTASFLNVLIAKNTAQGGNGGNAGADGLNGGDGGYADGGGFYAMDGTLNFTGDDNLLQNVARGGNGGTGSVGTAGLAGGNGTNGSDGGNGGNACGGGLWLFESIVNISGSLNTVIGNSAIGGNGGAGGAGGNGGNATGTPGGNGGTGGNGGDGGDALGGGIYSVDSIINTFGAYNLGGNQVVAGHGGFAGLGGKGGTGNPAGANGSNGDPGDMGFASNPNLFSI
jgi:hypothetical protein